MGALLSALMLGLVLVRLQSRIGMPAKVLYLLAAIAAVFCIFSLSCCALDVKRWRGCLRIIACANLLYCCLTLGVVIYLYRELSLLGIGYFTAEMAVIVALATFEFRVASRDAG